MSDPIEDAVRSHNRSRREALWRVRELIEARIMQAEALDRMPPATVAIRIIDEELGKLPR